MNGYSQILRDMAHDMEHLAKLVEGGRLRDDHILATMLQMGDDLKAKALTEAATIRTHPVLFVV